jgi:hypothetical protein
VIYVVRASDGHYYRRGKLVRSEMAASFGHSPSGVAGIIKRASARFPDLQWEAVPFRMAQSSKEKQEAFRARQAMLGQTEVRGIFAPPTLHAVIKEAARKVVEQQKPEEKK